MNVGALSGVVNHPFDPWDHGHRDDPKPFYKEMREAVEIVAKMIKDSG